MLVLKGLSLKGSSAETDTWVFKGLSADTDTQVIKGFFIETDS